MKTFAASALLAALLAVQATGCSTQTADPTPTPTATPEATESDTATTVDLSDSGITVDGAAVDSDTESPVLVDQPLYDAAGESTATAVVITQPGTYRLSGTLTDGQVAVDLGTDAASDPEAVVTLILDGVDITCSSAPALVVENVYECADLTAEITSPEVDTTTAGISLVLADGSENTLTSTSADAVATLSTAMSLNVSGQEEGDGLLTVTSASAGIQGAAHLTLDSGRMVVQSQSTGLQANEEALSVITVNGGKLFVNAGQDGASSAVASQGYVVVNDGELVALSADEGLSASSGVQINGGSVLAMGSAVTPVDEGSAQAVLDWIFTEPQSAGALLTIQDGDGEELLSYTLERDCTAFLFSSPQLTDASTCTVTVGNVSEENGDA